MRLGRPSCPQGPVSRGPGVWARSHVPSRVGLGWSSGLGRLCGPMCRGTLRDLPVLSCVILVVPPLRPGVPTRCRRRRVGGWVSRSRGGVLGPPWTRSRRPRYVDWCPHPWSRCVTTTLTGPDTLGRRFPLIAGVSPPPTGRTLRRRAVGVSVLVVSCVRGPPCVLEVGG